MKQRDHACNDRAERQPLWTRPREPRWVSTPPAVGGRIDCAVAANPYRSGGARLPMAALAPLLTAGENEIVVQLG
jgi:hypothetical protein